MSQKELENMRAGRQMRARVTEFRAGEAEGKRFIEGYFSVFGDIYELWQGATESVDSHAFDETINGDIRALIDHETRLVIGRTKAGTLTLRIDSRGLWGRIEINENDIDAMNLWHRVQRGDVDQCSFGFNITGEEMDVREDGSVHWTITKVDLFEVSCVTFPAYENTSIQARKEQLQTVRNRQAEAWREKMKRRLKRNGS